MEKTECYLGTPNGVVLCIDRMEDEKARGRFYHSYSREATEIQSMDELPFLMEELYDFLRFPLATTGRRTFGEGQRQGGLPGERTKIMRDDEVLSKHGDLGTFIIRVQHRQNSSWQGRITWMEKNKTVYFRSVWEMIKLVAGALDTISDQDGATEEPHWPEEEERQGL